MDTIPMRTAGPVDTGTVLGINRTSTPAYSAENVQALNYVKSSGTAQGYGQPQPYGQSQQTQGYGQAQPYGQSQQAQGYGQAQTYGQAQQTYTAPQQPVQAQPTGYVQPAYQQPQVVQGAYQTPAPGTYARQAQGYEQPQAAQQPYSQPQVPQQTYGQPQTPQQPYGQPQAPQQAYAQPQQGQQPYAQPTQAPQPAHAPTAPALPRIQPPALAHPMQKGQKLTLGPADQATFRVCMGYNVSVPGIEIDASAFMLGEDGKLLGDDWLVFYGQESSPDNSVILSKEAKQDRKRFDINTANISPAVKRIVFILTADGPAATFGNVTDIYARILDGNTRQELAGFLAEETYGGLTALMLCEIYKHGDTWKCTAIGNGVAKDLAGLCEFYGAQVEK